MDFLINVIFPSIITFLLGLVAYEIKENRKERKNKEQHINEQKEQKEIEYEAMKKSIVIVLRYMLYRYHSQFMQKAFITSDEYNDYKEMYDVYHALGGNGSATKWWHEICTLPIKDDISVPYYYKHGRE